MWGSKGRETGRAKKTEKKIHYIINMAIVQKQKTQWHQTMQKFEYQTVC